MILIVFKRWRFLKIHRWDKSDTFLKSDSLGKFLKFLFNFSFTFLPGTAHAYFVHIQDCKKIEKSLFLERKKFPLSFFFIIKLFAANLVHLRLVVTEKNDIKLKFWTKKNWEVEIFFWPLSSKFGKIFFFSQSLVKRRSHTIIECVSKVRVTIFVCVCVCVCVKEIFIAEWRILICWC